MKLAPDEWVGLRERCWIADNFSGTPGQSVMYVVTVRRPIGLYFLSWIFFELLSLTGATFFTEAGSVSVTSLALEWSPANCVMIQRSDPSVVLSVTIAARGSKMLSEFMSRLNLKSPLPGRPGDNEWPISTRESRSVVVGARDEPRQRRCAHHKSPHRMSRKRLRHAK